MAAAFDAAADRAEARERSGARIREALDYDAAEAREAGQLGYLARLLVQVTMPHARTEATIHERRNGPVSVAMLGDPRVGLPYGTYPRLVLAWITTEAVRTRSHILELGDSLSAWMGSLGLMATGGRWGTVGRVRDHVRRLATTAISYTYTNASGWRDVRLYPVEGSSLWWDPKSPEQGSLWRSTLVLHRAFFEELVTHPVPIDLRVLRALARDRSPLALDIYTWLTWRMSYLRRVTVVPWDSLRLQFGGDYGRVRDFKSKFIQRMQTVLAYYPEAKVSATDAGLQLRPSPTHVRRLAS
jgi:hypothetical protein